MGRDEEGEEEEERGGGLEVLAREIVNNDAASGWAVPVCFNTRALSCHFAVYFISFCLLYRGQEFPAHLSCLPRGGQETMIVVIALDSKTRPEGPRDLTSPSPPAVFPRQWIPRRRHCTARLKGFLPGGGRVAGDRVVPLVPVLMTAFGKNAEVITGVGGTMDPVARGWHGCQLSQLSPR